MRSKKEYPEWVEKFRTEGTTIKFVRGRYYLYNRLGSKRVEGKKNPQPVDEYIGVITQEDGLVYGKKKRVAIDGVEVREYGFSKAMLELCPDSWKQIHGVIWHDLLKTIIFSKSPNTYLQDEGYIRGWDEYKGIQKGAVISSLQRKITEEHGVGIDELLVLGTVFAVKMGKKTILSNLHEDHIRILSETGLRMEVR